MLRVGLVRSFRHFAKLDDPICCYSCELSQILLANSFLIITLHRDEIDKVRWT